VTRATIDRAGLARPVGRVTVVFVAVGLLGLTMNWISANLVAPIFSYLGYSYVPAPWQTLLVVTLLTTAVALSLPRVLVRPSHVVLWTIFVVCVSPTMIMSISTGYVSDTAAIALSATVGAAFALVSLATPRGATAPVARVDPSDDVLVIGARRIDRGTLTWWVCGTSSLVTYGLMAATVGIHLRFVALDDIYEVRADYSADVGTGGVLGYLLTGQAYVINPLVLARGIFRRRPSLVVLALAGQFLLYSSTGFKAVLFSFIAVLGMALLFRGTKPTRSLAFLGAPLVIMVVSAVADEVQGGITWTSVFTRRFMLTPGLLSSVYVDYFSDNPVARYGYSFLSPWVEYPYDLPPPKRISDYLVPGSVGYANANLFADGFANLGWVGIFVAAAALFVWLRFLDGASRGLPMRVAAMAVVMPSIMLSNTSIFTAMLSHGLLMGTLILLIAPRSGWERASPGRRPAVPGGDRRRTRSRTRRRSALVGTASAPALAQAPAPPSALLRAAQVQQAARRDAVARARTPDRTDRSKAPGRRAAQPSRTRSTAPAPATTAVVVAAQSLSTSTRSLAVWRHSTP
jgi:hypothetical protein